MNPREKCLAISLFLFFIASGIYRSSEHIKTVAGWMGGGRESSFSPSLLSSSSSLEEANYYPLSTRAVDNLPKQIEELLLKSRHPIPITFEANFVEIEDIFLELSKNETSYYPEEDLEEDSEGSEQRYDRTVVPFYWHIPRSGSGMMSNILGQCLGLTIASSSSIHLSQQDNTFFKKVFNDDSDLFQILWFHKSTYVNINLDTIEGIQRASRLGILQNNVTYQDEEYNVDVMISPRLYEISNILIENMVRPINGTKPKASMFAMFRNPIERDSSNFYHLRRFSPIEILHKFEMIDWLRSEYYLDNMMTRSLVNKMHRMDEITMDDLLSAKEILRRKCIVGLLEEKVKSWERFKQVYRIYWDHDNKESGGVDSSIQCQSELLLFERPNMNHYVYPHESRAETLQHELQKMLEDLNEFDLILYEYAKYLFLEQEQFFK